MKRRALVLLFTCGLLLANYPGKIVATSQASGTSTICKRCYHSKKEHYSGTGMCLYYDGCGSFVK
jgi:hypothetical protein